MAAAFHHGTETIRIDGGSSPVYTVDGAITAIIGTAPIGRPNELTVCQTLKDFAQFGAALTGRGFTIPDAANIWTRYGAGIAYVVNVCDPAKHKSSVTGEILAVDAATLSKNQIPRPAYRRPHRLRRNDRTDSRHALHHQPVERGD